MDLEDIQPVEQIQTKLAAGTNCRRQVAVCGCYYTHIDWNALSAPDALEFVFLKHPQQSNLGFARRITDLVEKNGPAVRDFETPESPAR